MTFIVSLCFIASAHSLSTGTGLLELVDVLVLQMEKCVKSAKEKESPDGRCYECLLTISQLFLNGIVLLYPSDGQHVADHLASNTAQVETLIEALVLCYSPPQGMYVKKVVQISL